MINWPAVAPAKTWTGATSTAWNVATNWSPAGVPTGTDDVLIPAGTPNSPSITTNQAVRDLTVAPAASLDLPSSIFTINGNIDVQGAVTVNAGASGFRPNGTGKTIKGAIDNVDVRGTYSLSGPLTVTNLFSRGSLDVNGQILTVANDFSLLSAGTFTMQHPLDHVIVSGQMLFTGGSTAGLLTEGLLEVKGRLLQNNSGTGNPANSFSPSGNHTTKLTASSGTQQVDIFNTGTGATLSHFNNLDLSALTGTIDLVRFNTLFVEGTLTSNPAGAPGTVSTANAAKLQAGAANVGGLVFNAVPLSITGGITRFDNVTFQGMDQTQTQLSVANSGGSPFTFNNLIFSTTPTTGLYLSANDIDGATGGVLVIDMANPAPATPGAFTSVAGGAVINWPVVVPVKTWNGSLSTDWNTPGNWTPSGIPGITDDVVIPNGTVNMPAITSVGSYQIRGLTIQNLTFLSVVGGADVNASGDVDVAGSISGGHLTLAGPAGRTVMASGSLTATQVASPRTLIGFTTVAGDLFVDADLTVNGQTLQVSGILTVNARLIMTNPIDQVFVNNAAIFQGQSSTGTLTAGVLSLLGNFTQSSPTSTTSFNATGTHITRFTNEVTQVITFDNAGPSNFNVLDVTNAFGQIVLASPVTANSQLVSTSTGFSPTILGNGNPLTVTGLNVNGLTLDNVLLSSVRGTITAFNQVTFNNYAAGATQFSVSQDGPGSPFNFDQLKFNSLPTTGFYISALDLAPADGSVFTVNLTNPLPTTGAPFIQSASGAVVNWPFGTPSNIWTGQTDGQWSTATNWSLGHVPTNADDVIIASGGSFFPTLSTSCSAKSLRLNPSTSLDLNGVNCQIQTDYFSDGFVSGPGVIQMQGTGQVRGNAPNMTISGPVTATGQTSVSGSLVVTGATGILDLGGQVVTVGGAFSTQGGALLKMVNPADNLSVVGDATFSGGNELNSMSAGTLILGGNLTQVGTGSPDSFHPSGTQLTVLSGVAPTVTFGTPGIVPGSSHFESLSYLGGGTLLLGSNVFAHEDFTVTGSVSSTGKTLQVGGVNSAGAVFDNTQLIIDQPNGQPLALDNVTFQNMDPTATQLTVNHPGAASPFAFSGLTFARRPPPASTCRRSISTGRVPNVLTLDVTGATPATPGSFVQKSNGAVVTWNGLPAGPPTWTGALSTDWSNAGNWTSAVRYPTRQTT